MDSIIPYVHGLGVYIVIRALSATTVIIVIVGCCCVLGHLHLPQDNIVVTRFSKNIIVDDLGAPL